MAYLPRSRNVRYVLSLGILVLALIFSWVWLKSGGVPFTQAELERMILKGMTEQEVSGILGNPILELPYPWGLRKPSKRGFLYEVGSGPLNDGYSVYVDFNLDGRVIGRGVLSGPDNRGLAERIQACLESVGAKLGF